MERLRPPRDFIGKGGEHLVVRARSLRNPTVLKTPYGIAYLASKYFPNYVPKMRQELAEANLQVSGSEILVPKTRIIRFRDTYVIAQDEKPDEGTFDDKKSIIDQPTTPPFIADRFEGTPENFTLYKETLWWVDPIGDFYRRILKTLPVFSDKALQYTKNTLHRIRNKITTFSQQR